MILPAGVTKGSALVAALDELGLSPHNTMAVGDAENDLSLLRGAEVGVAVANAVTSLAEHADLVLDKPNGAGVRDLLEGPLLQGHERHCPRRRWISIGTYGDDDSPVLLPASQSSLLVAGDTGAGKSYLAGLLAERWVDAGYAVLVIDPEGDHRSLASRAGVHLVDAANHAPDPHELLALMQPRHTSLVLDLSRLDVDAQLDYLRRMPTALTSERVRHGIPHWVIYEEAHQGAWLGDEGASLHGLAEAGTCLVTWRPELLPVELARAIETTITLAVPSGGAGDRTPRRGTIVTGGEARDFLVGERVSPHVRHRRKYAATPLPADRRFRFHDEAVPAVAPATLEEFSQRLLDCAPDTLEYHLGRGDFSRWVTEALTDRWLGTEFGRIENDLLSRRALSLERARRAMHAAIERRYLGD